MVVTVSKTASMVLPPASGSSSAGRSRVPLGLAPDDATIAAPPLPAAIQDLSACAAAPAAPRRTVKVSDLDKLSSEMQAVRLRCDQLEQGMEACKDSLSSSRLSLNGLRALQQVARQEQYPLGRSLQRRLSTRLIERLKPPPPSGLNRSRDGASQRENRTKVVLSFDADADRRSMDELVEMLSLSYAIPGPGRRERAARLVEFSTPGRLVAALGMSESLQSWAMARSFTRPSDGSTPSRVLVERFEDEAGSIWFILQRRKDGELLVATRKTEEFHPQRRRFVHPLERTTVSSVDLSGVPDACPAFLRWRPSAAAPMMGHDDGLACGRVTLSLPCCVVELDAQEVLDVIEAHEQQDQQ